MKPRLLLLAALTLAGAYGCTGDGNGAATDQRPATSTPRALSSSQHAKVDKAAAVARAIEAGPADTDAALQQHGMTEQQFEDLMYEIAADPAMSRAYNAKMGR